MTLHTTSRLRSGLLAVLCLAMTAAWIPANAAHSARSSAATGDVVSTHDTYNDVWIGRSSALSAAQKKSIDLRHFTVRRADHRVRFTAELRHVITGRRWDQMLFVTFTPSPAGSADWSSDFGVTTKGKGYAFWTPNQDYDPVVNCHVAVSVHRASDTVVVDVPPRCIPSGRVKMKVLTATGYFETDAPAYSRDRFTIAGPYTLKD